MGGSDQIMVTQGPPYSVPDSEIGTTHLGVILHLFPRKSQTYPFLLGEDYNEGYAVWGLVGSQGIPDQAAFPFTLLARTLTCYIIAGSQAQTSTDAQMGHSMGQIGGTVAPTQAGVDCLLRVQGSGQRRGEVQVGEVR